MKKQRKVILYGDSLILEGIRANLGGCADLEVVSLTFPLPAEQELDALAPDAIIFDLEAAHRDTVLALQRERPQMLLVGVNLATNQMLLWSGEQSHGLAMSDLVLAIRTMTNAETAPESSAQPDLLARWDSWIAAHAGLRRLKARQRTLILAAAAVVLCAVLIVNLVQPNPGSPLVGAAIGGQSSLDLVLAFTAGLFLGGLALALWMRRRG
jgi:hypothetical protein